METNVNQLLRNYLFELKEKLKRLPSHHCGSVEFTNDQIRRVETAINQGDPDYKHKPHSIIENTKQNSKKDVLC